MKWNQFWMMLILLLAVSACSPSIDSITTSTVAVSTSTPTSIVITPTPIPTDIPTTTFTPSPTQTSTATPSVTPLPPTSTPVPTPDIQFRADRSYIKVGMCVVFTWNVENSKSVYFYAEGEPWEEKMVPPRDSREECRKVSTIYHLRVVSLDNTVDIREIHIPVEPMPGL